MSRTIKSCELPTVSVHHRSALLDATLSSLVWQRNPATLAERCCIRFELIQNFHLTCIAQH